MYLNQILNKYEARDLTAHGPALVQLSAILKSYAATCYVDILPSGSREKGTAIALASDVDYLVSLSSNCNANAGGLKTCYDALYEVLSRSYPTARKQNVSVRIRLGSLEVDITPAKKQAGSANVHSLYVSKSDSWIQTNIQRHIVDISQSGRTDEIKVMKIWRELHGLDFPSIYLEYLLVSEVLYNKSKSPTSLEDNVSYVLVQLAKETGNPLFSRVVDPANSNNILSDLLTVHEKNLIISAAARSVASPQWSHIVW